MLNSFLFLILLLNLMNFKISALILQNFNITNSSLTELSQLELSAYITSLNVIPDSDDQYLKSEGTFNSFDTLNDIALNYSYTYNSSEDVYNVNREIIPSIKALISQNNFCFKYYNASLSQMSFSEQKLLLAAYSKARNDSLTSNDKRCFSPSLYKQFTEDIIKGSALEYALKLTNISKSIRSSLNCFKSTLGADYDIFKEATLLNAIDSLSSSNQCSAFFITKLLNILANRKRYLITTINTQNVTSYLDNNGNLKYPYTTEEMLEIVQLFIGYAKCSYSTSEIFVQTFSQASFDLYNTTTCNNNKNSKRIMQSNDTSNNNINDISNSIFNQSTTFAGKVYFNADISVFVNSLVSDLNASNNSIHKTVANSILKLNQDNIKYKSKNDMLTFIDGIVTSDISAMTNNYNDLYFNINNFNKISSKNFLYVLHNINTTTSNGVYSYYDGTSFMSPQFAVNITWLNNKPFDEFYAALGCFNGNCFTVIYMKDEIKGNFYQFIGNNFKLQNTALFSLNLEKYCFDNDFNILSFGYFTSTNTNNNNNTNLSFSFNSSCFPLNLKGECKAKLLSSCKNSKFFDLMFNKFKLNLNLRALNINCLNASSINATFNDYLQCLVFIDSNLISNSLNLNLDALEQLIKINNNDNNQMINLTALNYTKYVFYDLNFVDNDSEAKMPNFTDLFLNLTNLVSIDGSYASKQKEAYLLKFDTYNVSARISVNFSFLAFFLFSLF